MLRRYTALAAVALTLAACKQCGHGPDHATERPPKAVADKPPPAPALYRGLVARGARTLVESTEGEDPAREPRRLRFEVLPQPVVAGARVARLRWTLEQADGAKTELTAENNPANLPLHVAVSAVGLYLLDPEGQHADIKRSVGSRPNYPVSPRLVPRRTRPDGTYVVEARFKGNKSFCFGEGEAPGSSPPDCDDCDGMICFAAAGGLVHLSGNLAPDNGVFEQSGFEGHRGE